MYEINYLTNTKGRKTAVIIPIELWVNIFPEVDVSKEKLIEDVENYCLNKAMDEGKKSPLLNRQEALAYLENEDIV
ncbi:MAG: hypothetical protein OMM_07828 [Candidatus Magnetoglobus multicellularis str. Araruama]|uniref:Uncharacterized protein n=1 Tax=Candidatus Magnetoglobus multicellularis str. Araruama TaxID=890399 RepID=A0A1V1PAF2_9BACT|nr:MAG: hypothetical protein OMM_07828 [Candidatus Magnetoglobus multicellularis str. Araruama]